MKSFRTALAVTAAAIMAAMPANAVPTNPAASLSIGKPARAGAPAVRASQLHGEHGGLFIALGLGVALIVAIVVAGDSSNPSSP